MQQEQDAIQYYDSFHIDSKFSILITSVEGTATAASTPIHHHHHRIDDNTTDDVDQSSDQQETSSHNYNVVDWIRCDPRFPPIPLNGHYDTYNNDHHHHLQCVNGEVSSSSSPSSSFIGSAQRDMFVECALYATGDNNTLIRISDILRTSYRQHQSHKPQKRWQEVLTFNVRYCDLPSAAAICISVFDVFSPRKRVCIGGMVCPIYMHRSLHSGHANGPAVGALSLSNANEKVGSGLVLKMGQQRMRLVPKITGEELLRRILQLSTRIDVKRKMNSRDNGDNDNTQTVLNDDNDDDDDDILRLERLLFEHHQKGSMGGENARHQWLDRIVNTRINEIRRTRSLTRSSKSHGDRGFFINIELQTYDHAVVYTERDSLSDVTRSDSEMSSSLVRGGYRQLMKQESKSSVYHGSKQQVVVADIQNRSAHNIVRDVALQDNPVAAKHLKMSMNLWRGIWDKELKPDFKERDQLMRIANYTPLVEITTDERALLWRFRYWIVREKKLLTKFLRCVDWKYEKEKHEALYLLRMWSLIDIIDALELLSKQFENVKEVRTYAVNILKKTNDEELLGILLQLIQALRYENWFYSDNTLNAKSDDGKTSTASRDELTVGASSSTSSSLSTAAAKTNTAMERYRQSSLATFLLRRASKSFQVSNYLYWYLNLETEDRKYGDMFLYLRDEFIRYINSKSSSRKFFNMIRRQQMLVRNLTELCNQVKKSGWSETKIIKLREAIVGFNGGDQPQWKNVFNARTKSSEASPLLLPLHPTLEVVGINPHDATIFSSTTQPIQLSFIVAHTNDNMKSTAHGQQSTIPNQSQNATVTSLPIERRTSSPYLSKDLYQVIFKTGDDLRQDQLVIQVIEFIDRLLKKNNLDLRLTPYRVLACNGSSGFIECVNPSTPMSHIDNVRKWLWQQTGHDKQKYRIALDNFIKSCAGYCVITYILGIGDRHLDNLMCTPDGCLFHIDFGFILGKDPKYGAPPMKLCKEMVEGMGGSQSVGYQNFLKLCCTTYNVLRRHSTTILNLFTLMIDANIQHIDDSALVATSTRSNNATSGPGRAISSSSSKIRNHNIMKIQEKLRLELNDEQAIQYMQAVILESERALFAEINEILHRWAGYWNRGGRKATV